jgi:omega-amidase
VLGVNRVGAGGGHAFSGGSAIVDPMGTVVAAAGSVEGIIVADIDRATVAELRTSMPFLHDRTRKYLH